MSIEESCESDRKQEKILGIYPGFIENPDEIKLLNEVELYHKISEYDDKVWESRKRIRCELPGKCNDEYIEILEGYRYARDFCIYQTRKFGTDVQGEQEGVEFCYGQLFKSWYDYYWFHFNCKMTLKEFRDYLDAKSKGEDISSYLPSGDWKEFRIFQLRSF